MMYANVFSFGLSMSRLQVVVDYGRGKEISKALTYVLRHRARGLGLPIRSDGFLSVDEVLRTHRLLNLGCAVEEVRWAVQDSSKGRFALGEIEGALMIRATQGHSMGGIVEDQLLQPLTSNTPNLPSEAVHGAYMKYWPSIKGAWASCRWAAFKQASCALSRWVA